MDIWVVSSLGPVKESFNEHLLSFLLGKYLGMKWLYHIVGANLTFKKLPSVFKVGAPFCLPTSSV